MKLWDDRVPSVSLGPQVLFNEQQTPYVKLDVVTTGQKPQKLQCIEGYATTPSAGPHSFHFVKSCQVSGLLRLDRGTELQAITGSSFRLHTVGSPSASPHVFSIFKVNWSAALLWSGLGNSSHCNATCLCVWMRFSFLPKWSEAAEGITSCYSRSSKTLIWKTSLTFADDVVDIFFLRDVGTQNNRLWIKNQKPKVDTRPRWMSAKHVRWKLLCT